MPIIHGIDPGPDKSAIVAFDGRKVHLAEVMWNSDLLELAREAGPGFRVWIEMTTNYGKAGASVFDTCLEIGKLLEAFRPNIPQLVFSAQVRAHLCGTVKVGYPEMRQSMLSKYGKEVMKAVKGEGYHKLSALAIAHYGITKL